MPLVGIWRLALMIRAVLTSVCHHDFLDGSILALGRRVGVAGLKTHPPHGQKAEAASHRNVPQHPREEKKKNNNIEV